MHGGYLIMGPTDDQLEGSTNLGHPLIVTEIKGLYPPNGLDYLIDLFLFTI